MRNELRTLKILKRTVSGNSCWQGKLNISYDGYVSPCIMWNPDCLQEGSLKKYPLKQVLNHYIIPKYWKLSKDYIDTCKICEYRYICNDCRPLADSLTARACNCNYDPFSGKWN